MDKTGTLTKGTFKIKDIVVINNDESDMMAYLKAVESQSTHPIAKAILEHETEIEFTAINVTEIAGKGLKGSVNNKMVLAGNKSLMDSHNIVTPPETENIVESIVLVAIDGNFTGYVTVADELKEDAHQAVQQIKKLGIKDIIINKKKKKKIKKKKKKKNIKKKIRKKIKKKKKKKKKEKKKIIKKKNFFLIVNIINSSFIIVVSDFVIVRRRRSRCLISIPLR